jgi:hypothetical protein
VASSSHRASSSLQKQLKVQKHLPPLHPFLLQQEVNTGTTVELSGRNNQNGIQHIEGTLLAFERKALLAGLDKCSYLEHAVNNSKSTWQAFDQNDDKIAQFFYVDWRKDAGFHVGSKQPKHGQQQQQRRDSSRLPRCPKSVDHFVADHRYL